METENRKRKVIEAIARHLANVSTEDEERWLREWRAATRENEAFFQRFCEKGFIEQRLTDMAEADVDSAWYLVEKRIDGKKLEKKRYRFLQYAGVAAMIVGGVFLVVFACKWNFVKQESTALVQQQQGVSVVKEAHLVLGDGRVVKIDKAGNKAIDENGVVTIYKESGHLDYSRGKKSEDTTMVYNEMHTSYGMEYTVTLADGTRVFLNAASKLRYPVSFQGDRVVELEGEGYFCVAKDSLHPFIVKVHGMEVKVLGTEFNLRAHGDEKLFQTTLVKGRVQVKNGEQQYQIEPGEQVVYDRNSGALSVRDVDVTFYTAWRHAKIEFKDTSLELVVRELSRWYGVNFVFLDEESKRVELGGCINRYENITSVLDMLRRTELVNIVLENDIVYINKK